MKLNQITFSVLLMGLLFGGMKPAMSECPHMDIIKSDAYGMRASGRLVHGVLNVLSSPVQLFSETRHTIQCKKADLLLGLGNGVIATGKYLILGSWDLLTFWIPGDSGKSVAVTECGWEQAARGCDPSTCSMSSTASEPKN